MSEDTTKFSVLSSLFSWIQRSNSSVKKRSKFRKYLDTFCTSEDYFSSIRLILPSLDRERGSYGLKESVLSTCLVDALGMARDSADAHRLINWRRGGPKTGYNAGHFSLVAAEVLQRRQGMASGELTIGELNQLLDQLASSESRAGKVSLLSTLISKTNAQEMKWIVMIVLKDLKLGISEKSIFREFHPDAEDLFNVTCDLRLVCERLSNRSRRHERQDIQVGKAVRPQLAHRVADAAAAWKKLHGKEVVVECKFDGDRIQIHRNGKDINFFSRNFLDHSEYRYAMADVIEKCVQSDRCILDGEMLVWDSSRNCFAEFGSNQEIAKAAREGLLDDDDPRQLCYVAFDILYVGDSSVIHRSLKERHELLRNTVSPLKGRLEILVPDDGASPTERRTTAMAESCRCMIARDTNEVEKFFRDTVDNREEGIVLKDLGSRWEPSDRSGKWLKLKPDYIRPSSDLDVLIIGGYYGSGRHGGSVAQFLVGLADRPVHGASSYPRRFFSFCRLGTGLSDEERDSLTEKLKPYFKKYDYPRKTAPSCYVVTNNSRERPDVWIDGPDKSVILSITSDIRTIRSGAFTAPYSLRFPRIERVRYDKPWHDCLDLQSFTELVNSSNGTTRRTDSKTEKTKTTTTEKKKKKGRAVPSGLAHTDVSDVKCETLIFSGMVFYIINLPRTQSRESAHRLVAEHGGEFSMNLNDVVTHCVAGESKGIKYHAATHRHRDVIHYSWISDCCARRSLLPLQPKHFLFISDPTRFRLQDDVDPFTDSYFCDVDDVVELKQILSNAGDVSADAGAVDYCRRKYYPVNRCSFLVGCRVHCITAVSSSSSAAAADIELQRMKLEAAMAGGRISDGGISRDTTHVILFSSSASLPFASRGKVHVVKSQWLEDSLEAVRRVDEEAYRVTPPPEIIHACSSDGHVKRCRGDRTRHRSVRVKIHHGGGIGGGGYGDDQSGGGGGDEIVAEADGGRCSLPEMEVSEVDPVRSMLLEMIPGLGRQPTGAAPASSSAVDDGDRQNQVTKKKVSYRDMAKELLGDG